MFNVNTNLLLWYTLSYVLLWITVHEYDHIVMRGDNIITCNITTCATLSAFISMIDSFASSISPIFKILLGIGSPILSLLVLDKTLQLQRSGNTENL